MFGQCGVRPVQPRPRLDLDTPYFNVRTRETGSCHSPAEPNCVETKSLSVGRAQALGSNQNLRSQGNPNAKPKNINVYKGHFETHSKMFTKLRSAFRNTSQNYLQKMKKLFSSLVFFLRGLPQIVCVVVSGACCAAAPRSPGQARPGEASACQRVGRPPRYTGVQLAAYPVPRRGPAPRLASPLHSTLL